MPHTVRRAGRAIIPATSDMNVAYVGAVKYGRNDPSTRSNDPGSVCS
jgi:hypothetical protein